MPYKREVGSSNLSELKMSVWLQADNYVGSNRLSSESRLIGMNTHWLPGLDVNQKAFCGVEQFWQLVRLITSRSPVRIRPPQQHVALDGES